MLANAGRLFDHVTNFCAALAGVMLVGQMVGVCADVLARLLFNRPIDGITALTEWSLVYIAFLGAAWLQRQKGHVSVDMVLQNVSRGPALCLTVFSLLLGLFVTALVTIYGTRVTWIKFVENEYDFFKLAWMPLWVIYAAIPLGAALWFIQLCRDLHTALTNPPDAAADHHPVAD